MLDWNCSSCLHLLVVDKIDKNDYCVVDVAQHTDNDFCTECHARLEELMYIKSIALREARLRQMS